MPASVSCHGCGTTIELEVVGRSARCTKCGADLRCCLNCRFHDSSAYNDCSEPMAERVLEKDRANFCDYFSAGGASAASPAASGGGLSELEKLFRRN